MVRRAEKQKESYAKTLDRFVNEVDLNMAMAGMLGGLAAYGGIIPPFTRLLMTVAGSTGGAGAVAAMIPDKDKITLAASYMSPGGLLGAGAGTLMGILLKNYLQDNGASPEAAEAASKQITQTAAFASGALEGILMYKAFSNPEVMKGVLAMPGEIIKGIGGIIPG